MRVPRASHRPACQRTQLWWVGWVRVVDDRLLGLPRVHRAGLNLAFRQRGGCGGGGLVCWSLVWLDRSMLHCTSLVRNTDNHLHTSVFWKWSVILPNEGSPGEADCTMRFAASNSTVSPHFLFRSSSVRTFPPLSKVINLTMTCTTSGRDRIVATVARRYLLQSFCDGPMGSLDRRKVQTGRQMHKVRANQKLAPTPGDKFFGVKAIPTRKMAFGVAHLRGRRRTQDPHSEFRNELSHPHAPRHRLGIGTRSLRRRVGQGDKAGESLSVIEQNRQEPLEA